MGNNGQLKICSVCHKTQRMKANVCKDCRQHAAGVMSRNKIRATGYIENSDPGYMYKRKQGYVNNFVAPKDGNYKKKIQQ